MLERQVVDRRRAETVRGVRVDPALVERQHARAELEGLLMMSCVTISTVSSCSLPQPQDEAMHVLPDAGAERTERPIEQQHARPG